MARIAKNTFLLVVGNLLALAIVLASLHFMGKSPMPIIDEAINFLPVETVAWTGLRSSQPAVLGNWPPVKGAFYPDLVLSDQNGDTVRLSDFAGKVILLELAAVPCEGCQAFAGGQERGGFAGVGVQRDLQSIHHYANRYGGVELGSDEVVFVQLLLYGKSMSNPTQAEVAGWAKHFQMPRTDKTIVLQGDASMLGQASYQMIPGFHLIDDHFVLKYDSSGHHPEDDLYRDLLPALGRMVK
jgi:hypothetical protein